MGKGVEAAGFPDDWRDRVWAQVPKVYRQGPQKGSGHTLALAVAVLRLVAPRPAELVCVDLSVPRTGTPGVWIRIAGVKTDTIPGPVEGGALVDRGLGMRMVGCPLTQPEAVFLYEHVSAVVGLGRWLRVSINAGTLRVQLRTLGLQAMPGAAGVLSPYCFRHELASDLRRCPEMSRVDIARVLGHASLDSLRHYRTGRRGGVLPRPFVKVASEREPRCESASTTRAPCLFGV